jgi:NAD(P)-dependent dehydrogenase (short-subunit alcohol dehydrogenase family)
MVLLEVPAAAPGEAGATVICTGRTSRHRTIKSDYDRRETIEETAELVTSLGGNGIAVPIDHLVADEVKGLAERVHNEFGKIDILVNDIWGAELLKGGPSEWNTPVWKLDLEKGLRILRLAIDTHIITSKYFLPLLISQPGGLVVEVTDGTMKYNSAHYRISVYYDLAKVAVNRLAFSQGHELAPYEATAVAITPGWLRSEMMLDNFGVSEDNWRDAIDPARAQRNQPVAPPDFAHSESPRYVGRAIVSLALDPNRKRWNQQSLSSGELARVYGFTDLDGTSPDIWQQMEDAENN